MGCLDPVVAPEPAPPGAFDRPQALRFVGDLLVVTNSGFHREGWRPGSLTVVDPVSGTVVNRIETAWPNPTRLVVRGEALYVVDTGELDVADPHAPRTSPGGVETVPAGALGAAGRAARVLSLAPLSAPVDIAFVGDLAVATSAVRGQVAIVEGETVRLRTYAEGLGLGNVAAWRDLFLVTDFNSDALRVVDARGRLWDCAVDLGESPRDLEGPQSAAVLGDRLYVVLAISGALRAVELPALEDSEGCGAPTVETVVAPLGQVPNDLRAHGGRLYVVDSADHLVTAYDPTSGEAVRRWSMPPGSNPWHVDLSPDGRWMAVTEWAADAVRIFDLANDDTVGRRVGGEPDEVAAPPAPRPSGVVFADEVVDAPTSEGPFRDPRRAVNGVRGAGERAGGTDVFSLRPDERLVLRWSGRRVVDGPGADLVVFENAFRVDESAWFLDPVVVEVSRDGVTWVAFPHDYEADDETVYDPRPAAWSGFAGLGSVTLHEEDRPLDPFDRGAGGDAFDLADLEGAEGDAIRREGFVLVRLGGPGTNPDTGAAYPSDPVSNGPDIDGVYARVTAPE